jgi:hypothetical protein
LKKRHREQAVKGGDGTEPMGIVDLDQSTAEPVPVSCA